MQKLSDATLERIALLQKKYEATGQDLNAYLDGLLHTDYLNYWDYIQVDTLLTLQKPKTYLPDERIFILYHQITELYFRLIRNEIEAIQTIKDINAEVFLIHLNRINKYFEHLINSFEIMIHGMDKEQFLTFRMALLPASGFQSAQYRIIELASADITCLMNIESREKASSMSDTEKYQHLYWKRGAIQLATNKKTFTLLQFEAKYESEFLELIEKMKNKNLWQCYKSMHEKDQNNPALITAMRTYDCNANIRWPLMHYKSAVHYLERKPEDIAATGGTNWQKYLPPKNQKICFYPELWSESELAEWGKSID